MPNRDKLLHPRIQAFHTPPPSVTYSLSKNYIFVKKKILKKKISRILQIFQKIRKKKIESQ